MLYGLFFLLGVFTTNLLQALFNITPLYKLWKVAEVYFLNNLVQCEMLRQQSLAIVRLCYIEVDRESEYDKVQEAINKKFKQYEEVSLQVAKKMLPYSTSYTNVDEAVKWITEKQLKGEINDV